MRTDVITHYDLLIDEGNDPVLDPPPLQKYMDRWDGRTFLKALHLTKEKSVLEIGVGTGRLAVRTAPLCGQFTGIDISPKTVERAREHLRDCDNVTLLCGDFLTYDLSDTYDVIYSSLTWMHIRDKRAAVGKVARLLKPEGRFVLSVSKDTADTLLFETRSVTVFPDDPAETEKILADSGLFHIRTLKTEAALIYVAIKQ